MKKIIFILCVSLFFMQSSCQVVPNSSTAPPIIIQQASQESIATDTKPPRTRSTSSGARGKRCESDDNCMDICEDLYKNNGSVEECGELHSSRVREMDDLVHAIRNDDITVKELKRFGDDSVFKDMMEISVHPWVYIIKRRVSRPHHAKTILAWIASNPKIMDAVLIYDGKADFSSNYRAYEGLARLFVEAAGAGNNDCEKYEVILRDKTHQPEIIGAGKSFRGIRKSVILDGLYSKLPKDLNKDNNSDTCVPLPATHYHHHKSVL